MIGVYKYNKINTLIKSYLKMTLHEIKSAIIWDNSESSKAEKGSLLIFFFKNLIRFRRPGGRKRKVFFSSLALFELASF